MMNEEIELTILDSDGSEITVHGLINENHDYVDLQLDPNEYLYEIYDWDYEISDFIDHHIWSYTRKEINRKAGKIAAYVNQQLTEKYFTNGTSETTRRGIEIEDSNELPYEITITWTDESHHISAEDIIEEWKELNPEDED